MKAQRPLASRYLTTPPQQATARPKATPNGPNAMRPPSNVRRNQTSQNCRDANQIEPAAKRWSAPT